MVKWISLVFLVVLGCSKPQDNRQDIIKFIYETQDVDKGLWEVKLIKEEPLSQTRYHKTLTQCENLNVIYSINLLENCYESKSLFEENIITAQIGKAFATDSKIYQSGKCYTAKDVDKNLEEWRETQYKMVGQKICLSYKHILLGGGCDKEATITKEMIDEDFKDIQVKAKSDLNPRDLHNAGEQHLESLNLNICKTKDGQISLSN